MVDNNSDLGSTKFISTMDRLQQHLLENEDIYLSKSKLFKYYKLTINRAIFQRAFAENPLNAESTNRYESVYVRFNFEDIGEIFNFSPLLKGTSLERYCPNCLGIEETEECPECDEGSVECQNCNGAGSWDCGECDGRGYVPCGECGGDNQIDCAECEGEGEVQTLVICRFCEGSGDIEDEKDCDTCGGDGEVEKGDDVYECVECDGTGTVNTETPCGECEGDGQIEELQDCDECGGEGQIECPDCDEDGEIRCDYCDEGTIECEECYGDGTYVCSSCEGAFESRTCSEHTPQNNSFSNYLPKELQKLLKYLPNFKVYRGSTKKLNKISPNRLNVLITPRAIAVKTADYFKITCVFEVTNNLQFKYPLESKEIKYLHRENYDLHNQIHGINRTSRNPFILESITFEAEVDYSSQKFSSEQKRFVEDAIPEGSEVIWDSRNSVAELTSILLVSDFNIEGTKNFMNWDGSPFF